MYVTLGMKRLQSLQNTFRDELHLRACQLSALGDSEKITVEPPHNQSMRRSIWVDFIE
jgi:hypothetical protein